MCVHIHIIIQKVYVYVVNMLFLDNMNPKHTYPGVGTIFNYKSSRNVFLCDVSRFVIAWILEKI